MSLVSHSANGGISAASAPGSSGAASQKTSYSSRSIPGRSAHGAISIPSGGAIGRSGVERRSSTRRDERPVSRKPRRPAQARLSGSSSATWLSAPTLPRSAAHARRASSIAVPVPAPRPDGTVHASTVAMPGSLCQPTSAKPAPTSAPSRMATNQAIASAWPRQSTHPAAEIGSDGAATERTPMSRGSASSPISCTSSTRAG